MYKSIMPNDNTQTSCSTEPTSNLSATPELVSRLARGIVSIAMVLTVLFSCCELSAQITAKALIGNAVPGDPSRNEDVTAAIKRFENRDYLAARTLLERAGQNDPKLPPVDLTLAKMYVLSGQVAAGRASLERTVRDQPGDPETYIILADQLYSQGRLIESEALYDKAILLIDDFSANAKRKHNFIIQARAGRAAVAEVRKDWDSALADLTAWAEADPDTANAHHRLGRALFLSGKTSEAMRELEKAKELQEDLPNPLLTAAILYEQTDNQDEAKKAFTDAIRKDGKDKNTLLAYGQWLIKTNDLSEAEKILAEARRVAPDGLDVLTLSGVVAKMAGKRQPAEDYFTQALAVAPSNHGILNQMALLLIEQAQVDPTKAKRALEFAKISAQLYQDNSESNITLAWVLYQLRQNKAANQALQKGLQLGSLNADSRYLVSKMLAEQGRKDDAKRLLRESLENSAGIFVHRSDAQALLDSFN